MRLTAPVGPGGAGGSFEDELWRGSSDEQAVREAARATAEKLRKNLAIIAARVGGRAPDVKKRKASVSALLVPWLLQAG